MDIETKLREFEQVRGFECPAEFWPALGYEGDARYAAIWWEPAGDEACWSDGRSSICGAEWAAYQELIEFNFPLGYLVRRLLGSSEEPAEYHLVIDRQTEGAWLVPAGEAWEALRLQWPAVTGDVAAGGIGVVSFEDVRAWLGAIHARLVEQPAASMEEIERQMEESRVRYEALVAALERRQQARGLVK